MALTVVVGPSTAAGAEVRDVLSSWVLAGLLRPGTLWVDPERWEKTEGDVSTTREAEQLGPDGVSVCALVPVIAAQATPTVRVVALQLIVSGEAADARARDAAEAVAEVVRRALARAQRLVRINLLVPTSGARVRASEVLLPGWQANIAVSSEDRISDRHATTDISYPENLVPHAALAVATVAGLWSSSGDSPFDDSAVGISGDATSRVPVVRSFARVLRSEPILGRVADDLFARRASGAISASVMGATQVPDPPSYVSGLADRIVERNPELQFNPTASFKPPRPQRVRVLVALGRMFRYLWSALRQAPSLAADKATRQAKNAVENLTQRIVFGADSNYRVVFGGRPDECESPPDDVAEDARAVAERLLDDWRVPRPTSAHPALWRTLRGASFALADGSALPSALMDEGQDAVHAVITDVRVVAPHPADTFSESLGTVRACDALQAHRLRDLLVMEVERARAEQATATTDAEVARARARVERAEARLAALDAWISRRAPSMLWKVADRAAIETDRALKSAASSLEAARNATISEDRAGAEAIRRTLRNRVAVGFLLWAIAVGLAVAAGITAGHGPWANSEVVGIASLALLSWLSIAHLLYERRVFQLSNRYALALARYLHALESAENDLREVSRLASIYVQFRDWAEVIGWMLHRPEGVQPDGVSVREDHALHATPAALQVAIGVPEQEQMSGLVMRVARCVFVRGWLVGLYDRYLRLTVDSFALRSGLVPEAVDPDTDVAEPVPRVALLEDLVAGRHGSAWRADVSGVISNEVEGIDPTTLFAAVERVETQSLVEPVDAGSSAREFLRGIEPGAGDPAAPEPIRQDFLTDEAAHALKNEVRNTDVYAPRGFGFDQAGVRAHDTAVSTTPNEAFQVQVIRLDHTVPVSPTDLKFLEDDPPTRPPGLSGDVIA